MRPLGKKREITEDYLIDFCKKALTRRTKKMLGISSPIFGKNKSKLFIKPSNYRALLQLYILFPSAIRDDFLINIREGSGVEIPH